MITPAASRRTADRGLDSNGVLPADVLVDLRHHRRPGEGDDLPLALPAGAARAARLPDRRAWRATTGPSSSCASARAASIEGCGETIDEDGLRALRRAPVLRDRGLHRRGHLRARRGRDRRRAEPGLLPGDPAVPVRAGDQAAHGRGAAPTARAWSSRSPSATTSPRRARSRRKSTSTIDESPALPDRPLPRQDGHRRAALPALRQHDDRADLEPQPHRLRADHDGRGLRRRGPRPLLRPGRRAARRGRQPHDAGRRPGRDGGARRQRRGDAQGRQVRAVPLDRTTPSPAHYVRGQYDGYLDIDGVAKDSTTETYAALRLEIDNWRWSGVPWFIRTGKRLPVTQTELRAVFRDPPRLGFMEQGGHRRPSRTSSSSSSTRRPGRASVLDAHRADVDGPGRSRSTWSSPRRGARRRPRTRCCCSTRCAATRTRFTRQDSVEETWRIFEPLLERRRRCTPTRRASGARRRRTSWSPGYGELARPVGGLGRPSEPRAERQAPAKGESTARAKAKPPGPRARLGQGQSAARPGRARPWPGRAA